jgi:AraC-like DNA-binding protein
VIWYSVLCILVRMKLVTPPGARLLLQNTEHSGIGRITVAAELINKQYYEKPRRLDCYALVAVKKGRGDFRDERGGAFPVCAGDAIVLFPGIGHSYGPPEGETWDELYLLFEGAVFDYWRDHQLLDPDSPRYRLDGSRLKWIWQDASGPLEQVCRLLTLLSAADREIGDDKLLPEQRQWMEDARDLLSRHALRADAAQCAARHMGMSYQVFRKTFRRLDGRPPGAFRTHVLMEEAARRLLTEATPIKTIALELNFCDEFHFTRRFREHHGTPPALYRRRMSPSVQK